MRAGTRPRTSADKTYFLHDIIHTIGATLTGRPQLHRALEQLAGAAPRQNRAGHNRIYRGIAVGASENYLIAAAGSDHAGDAIFVDQNADDSG